MLSAAQRLFTLKKTCALTGVMSLACAPFATAEVSSGFNIGFRHHSNIPNAADDNNRFGDSLARLDYDASKMLATSPGNNLLGIGLIAQSDIYQNSSGLNRLAAGATLAYNHRFGLGPPAPRVRLHTQLLYEHYDGSVRSGFIHETSLSASRWMSDTVLLSGSWQWTERNAREHTTLLANPMYDVAVFDQQRQELSPRADYIFSTGQAISLIASYADGYIEASARPGTLLRQIAEAIVQDNGIGRRYLAYRVKSPIKSAGLQWNFPLGDNSSVSVGAERQLATAQAGVRYQETRVHLDYLVRL